ncbi:MAG: hypothetical protein RJA57_1944, partial [Bacteroidota bacterium]
IYTKGSFFMHSLRFLIGDSVFLPTLKQLATDPAYTYDHFVTTRDVEALFSRASGQDLKPFFDFYMRTTDVLDFTVKETGYQQYLIRISNFFMPLPVEVYTTEGKQRLLVGKDGIRVSSRTPPQVDPRGFYLTKITQLP